MGLALFGVALAVGFVASSRIGERWMREEAELQLGRLLGARVHIERVGLRLRYGLEVHGVSVTAEYAAPESAGPDAAPDVLSAARVSASFHTASLLIGRVRIARLEIDGLELPLRRDPDGRWHPRYTRAGRDGEPQEGAPPLEGEYERQLAGLRGLIRAVHFLLRDQKIADHIVLNDAAVDLLDARPRAGCQETARIRIEGIDGRLDRSWLRGESDIELHGRWVGPDVAAAPLELAGRWRDEDSDLHVALAFTGIELAPLRPYLLSPRRDGDVAGRVSGVLAVVTPQPDRGLVEVDWSFDAFESAVALGDIRLKLSAPLETLQARLSLEPRRVRLESARVQGPAIEIRMRGNAARPLRRDSLVTLRADVSRTGLDDVRRLARGLPPAEAGPLLALLDRIDSGQVTTLGVRGGARLEQWQQLLAGQRRSLPDTLRVQADVADVTIGTSPTDTMSDVSARLTFSGETFELLRFRGRYNGEPLPHVALAVHGIGAVIDGPADREGLTRRAYPLPGLGALWDIVRGDPSRDPEHPPSPIRVDLDELHHPALRWPLRHARISIDPQERDLHVTIEGAEWAGRPIRGEAVLDRGDEPELRMELVVDSNVATAAAPEPADDAPSDAPPAANERALVEAAQAGAAADVAERDAPWASGRFESRAIHTGPIAFERIEGRFALTGQTLALARVRADLLGGGVLEGGTSIALDRRGEVRIGAELDARGASADRVARLFGLPAGFASGRADLRGRLAGPLRPGEALIDGMVGRIVIEARDGALRQKVPLLAALTHAIEGWSPSAASETLRFEQIDTSIELDRGYLSTDRFALEGPLRILASGSIDLNEQPAPVEATFGFFLLRQADQLLGNIPLVNLLVPGSDRGLIGAYFEATGTVEEPTVRPLPMKSIAQGVPLPEVLRQPFDALQQLFSTGSGESGSAGRTP